MRNLKTVLFAASVTAICLLRGYSVEIPLEKKSIEQGTRINIAYVDIERVFKEHQMTQRLKDEFQAEVEKRKKDLDKMQGGVDELKKVILASSTVVNQLQAQIETKKKLTPVTTGQAGESDISNMEAILQQREAELEVARKACDTKSSELEQMVCKNRDELLNLEDKNTAKVLSDIYAVMQKIADEEELTIILDKNEVLYGKDVRDLTDKVIERLHGR
jgi:Skp family chaperone for outer membrane proteins